MGKGSHGMDHGGSGAESPLDAGWMNECWRDGCAGSSSADLGTHIKWDTHPLGRTPVRIYGMALPANAVRLLPRNACGEAVFPSGGR